MVTDNYAKITRENLIRLYASLPGDLAENLPARREGDRFVFNAFGHPCAISPEGVHFGGGDFPSVLGILVSLYALNARPDGCLELPFRAFKEIPDSRPYVGAFSTHTEQVLVPHVAAIRKNSDRIRDALNGREAGPEVGGDFALIVYPLPKIALCYIFYMADEDFPAGVTCLYSGNARLFLPVDALADVGEYTSKRMVEVIHS
ncbi:MAG: DUF3786 domain-containing protein [Thermodesulfobacteriota bacterium]